MAASVSMTDSLVFVPATTTISVGDSVTWTNTGTAPHSVTADDGSFDSSPACPGNINACIQGGGTYTHTFGAAGTFGYHCKVHSGMSGTVIVQAGATNPGGGTGGTGGLPNTGPDGTTMVLIALGAALLLGGLALALVARRRRA
jgi:LPXTG-motif cell wall-anchored protein